MTRNAAILRRNLIATLLFAGLFLGIMIANNTASPKRVLLMVAILFVYFISMVALDFALKNKVARRAKPTKISHK